MILPLVSRCLSVLVLAVSIVSQADAQSQLPFLLPTEILSPTEEEASPDGIMRPILFGESIAVFGKTALVGAPVSPSPRVAIFSKTAEGLWQRSGSLQPEDPLDAWMFGLKVTLSFNTAAVFGPTGVFVFRRSGGTWQQTQKIVPKPGESFTGGLALQFGTLAIGVGRDNEAGAVDVYVSDLRGMFRPVRRLIAADGEAEDEFGNNLGFFLNVLAVSAAGDDAQRGAVYVFNLFDRRTTEHQKLLASDGAPGDRFGDSLALQDAVLAVGATGIVRDPSATDPPQQFPFPVGGGVYVFRPSGHFWSETQKLADPPLNLKRFGHSIAVNRDFVAVRSEADFGNLDALTLIYKRMGLQYQPVATAGQSPTQWPKGVTLQNDTLFLGEMFLPRTSAGEVRIYDLP